MIVLEDAIFVVVWQQELPNLRQTSQSFTPSDACMLSLPLKAV